MSQLMLQKHSIPSILPSKTVTVYVEELDNDPALRRVWHDVIFRIALDAWNHIKASEIQTSFPKNTTFYYNMPSGQMKSYFDLTSGLEGVETEKQRTAITTILSKDFGYDWRDAGLSFFHNHHQQSDGRTSLQSNEFMFLEMLLYFLADELGYEFTEFQE